MDKKILAFAIFCVESLAEKLGISGKEAYELLAGRTDVLESYIIACYEPLHTQSKQYIVEDLVDVLREKGAL